jgi:quercetin dioxygenase-like cupin family protein
MRMRINVRIALGLVVVGVTTLGTAAQQAGAPSPGITRTELENNATALIARLRMAPGAREDVHSHPFSAVVVQIGAGDVDMRLGDARSTTRRPHGFVEFIPKEVPHAAGNVGREPFDVVTIAMKPDRRPGGDAPASPAPTGITRMPVLDNAETRVTHVTFAPSAREPVHTHPFDLVVVPLTPGRVELRLGDDVSTRDYVVGEVIFLPRDVPHAVSNVGGGAFEMLSVGIK